MKTFNTQEEFLKEFPITDGIINCKSENFELKFDLNVEADICNARDIDAWNIKAGNIEAWNIKAWNISFYAVCFAYNDILCTRIKGERQNSKYFSLDGNVTIMLLRPKNNEVQKVKEEMKVSESKTKIADRIFLKIL